MISKSSPETASNTSCEELYIANEKLARKCLIRFFPTLANDEDVLQTARMALWRACQDFKPGKWQLSTLAYTYIRRDIIKEWRNSKRTKRAQETISLSTPIHDKSGSEYELEEVLPGAKNVDWCDSKAWWDSLTDRQREILRYRYDGKTYREIAEILGYSHTLIETEVRIAHKEAKDICEVKHVYKLTLCWSCANATGGCSWTARDPETGEIMFKPVEGWKARKTTLKGYRHENTSYHVIKCPEYKEDE